MGIAKKVRKKRMTAPLSVLDKVIYFAVMLIITAVMTVCVIQFAITIPENIAFSDGVIAVSSQSSWFNFMMIFMVWVMLNLPMLIGLDKKIPLFGNKSFKPSGKHPAVTLTPLFTKKFFTELTRKKRRYIKIYFIALVIITLVSAVVVGLCICPRKTLDENGNLVTYDSFNNITNESKLANAKYFTVSVEKVRQTRYRYHHQIEVEIIYFDESYTFSLPQFENMSVEEAVKFLLDVKEDLGSVRFRVEKAEDLEEVFDYYDYSEYEKKLIRELFDREN